MRVLLHAQALGVVHMNLELEPTVVARSYRKLVELTEDAVTLREIALTMEQVEEYNPPPNPAKMTDSRAAKYVEQHGASSWEVDALPPEVLSQLITEAFEGLVDVPMMDTIKEREEEDKEKLREAVEEILRGGA
jgi:hypothetical protein